MSSIVFGKKAVLEALRSGQSISSLALMKGIKNSPDVVEILNLAKLASIRVSWETRQTLDISEPNGNHQGVIARISSPQFQDLPFLLAHRDRFPIILACDHIQDSYNFGAMLRSAVSFGVNAVIFPKDRQAPLNSGAIKAAAGATSHLSIVRCTNLASALTTLKKEGYWIYGTDMNSTPLPKVQFNAPMVIVMGNEHKGMSKVVKKCCDDTVTIPMSGPLQSLNVSVSCGIVLYNAQQTLAKAKRYP